MAKQRSTGGVTFRAGLIGGGIMMIVRLVMMFITQGSIVGTALSTLIGCFVYFAIGRSAAQQIKSLLEEDGAYNNAVRSAGMGAAIITSITGWLFTLLVNVIRDAQGEQVFVDPRLLCAGLVIDLLIAAGLGAFGSKTVIRRHIDYT
jgi:hypothetical protein